MKQTLLILFLTSITAFIQGQNFEKKIKNEYLIGLNYCILTSGDQNGIHLENEYRRFFFPKLKLGFTLGFLHSAKESGILTINAPSNYDNNIATGDWGLSSEDGIKILDLETDQQTYIHVDVLVNYNLIKLNRINFEISVGGSVTYISNSFITRWELGTFYGEATGEQNLQLVYPYYSRIIDIGICASMDIAYNMSDKFIIVLMGGINNYPKSGYRFYDIGIKGGIKF